MNIKSERKRQLILEKAEEIFIKKGFTRVTMQDIVDACSISRGGIYLYFSSVSEIFIEVINNHHKARKSKFNIIENMDFELLLDKFFEEEKQELLSMKDSLKTAMYEFFLANKQNNKIFFHDALFELKHPIEEILQIGMYNKTIMYEDIDALAEMIMLWIEGMEALAVSTDISIEFLERQISFMKKIILRK